MLNAGDVYYRVDVKYCNSIHKIKIDEIKDGGNVKYAMVTKECLNGSGNPTSQVFTPHTVLTLVDKLFADDKTKSVSDECGVEYYKDRSVAVKAYNGYIKKSINALKALMVK